MNIINVGYRSTNYYLLDNGKIKLLIDAGWPGTLPKFIHILRMKDLRIEDISFFLVTHFHPDHAGLVQELKDAGQKLILPEEQLAAVPLLKQLIKQDVPYKEIRPGGELILPTKKSRAFLQGLGFSGEIIHTPGHSDDSITLVLDSGEAFTGDLTPWGAAGPDDTLLQESWAKLRALRIQKIYPGHGPVHSL
jgi:ribonuclease/clavin/mitogillin